MPMVMVLEKRDAELGTDIRWMAKLPPERTQESYI